jgi:hypothetical protein
MKKIIAAVFAMALILTACDSDKNEDVTTWDDEYYATMTTGTTQTMGENEAYAIDKLSMPSALPGGYYYYAKEENGITLFNDKARINIKAQNHVEDFTEDLAVYGDRLMASLTFTNLLYQTDTIIDKTFNTKFLGYDAVEYDFTLDVNQFEFNDDGTVKTNAQGEELHHVYATYKSIGIFFYSGEDAYYIIFETTDADYKEQEKLFRDVLNSMTMDEDLTADQTTTQSYRTTVEATTTNNPYELEVTG